MQCDYFDDARCRSCTLMGQTYAAQLGAKERRCESALAAVAPDATWMAPFASAEAGFRNKAKLVVGGRRGRVTVGILDAHGHGVDLRECGLYEPGLASLVPLLADAVDDLGLEPYDVPGRQGELKHVIVTHSPDGEVMLRFVLRSRRHLALLESRLPGLLARFPELAVVSVNLQPEHKAILEGDTEIILTERELLPMRVNDVTLNLRPNSFFQTNTAVAAGLYRQARDWVSEVAPTALWDLYCGVGGFALHCLDVVPVDTDVVGVEVSPEAVASAELSAEELRATHTHLGRLSFHVGDATTVGLADRAAPELVIVNPPRRGIGPELAGWLDRSDVRHVVYSSCNVDSLARDLALMPSFVPRRARLFDMFPQTPHHEVMVLLERS
ncbi:23S rRNA methyltransferase [Intrasporangium oryzae NRRL B-24470]|uniref:23S rRNA methyltransferase n=1 Tax=Intrasporangium oryzae NRRL B-24470 TaxID=1386089 RepID=W9G0X3_9MICO|nr:23S rRNA (uracil(747)-C(5))-methyltransferase RlmC [Intrasporangium oryzae]EWS99574.1 23S rRNA methyltransferase [Intrasporangium oryzae NRRL B-24470]